MVRIHPYGVKDPLGTGRVISAFQTTKSGLRVPPTVCDLRSILTPN